MNCNYLHRVAAAVAVVVLPCAIVSADRIESASAPRPGYARSASRQPPAVASFGSLSKSGNRSDRSFVGNILNTSVYEGCGCRFQFGEERRAHSSNFFFVADQSMRAWMNISGEDRELRLIGADHMSLKSRKGQKAYVRFAANGVEVRVSMLVTRTSTYEIDYEPARYEIVIQVVKGNHRETVRTIGSCGC